MAAGTRSAATDTQKLKFCVVNFLSVPDDGNYDDNEVVRALDDAGIVGFNDDFIGLSEADIQSLQVPPTTAGQPYRPLPAAKRRKLIVLLSYYHAGSRSLGAPIIITTVPKASYDDYRTSQYGSTKPIVPWNVNSGTNTDLTDWKKNVKPVRADFKEFRDEVYWIRQKERIVTTLESQNLEHLIQVGYRVTNKQLDDSQQKWLYKVFQDIMQAPAAKAIVTAHLTDKNTRAVWTEICEHFDSSMSSTIRCQQISSYLTSVRLHGINWSLKR